MNRTLLNSGANSIIKQLSRLESHGFRPSELVDDWISLCHATVTEIPRHYRHHLFNTPHQDLPQTTEQLNQVKDKYGERIEVLVEAMSILLNLAHTHYDAYPDFLGEVYMLYGYPKATQGQYFTPREIAQLMGAMVNDKEKSKQDIQDRLEAAIRASDLATAALYTMLVVPEELKLPWFLARVVTPALAHYEPVTILDPGCGSGVLLLAMASEFNPWQVRMGMVRFYGIDLDINCTRMAQTNIVLYGLNGTMRLPYIAQAEEALAKHGQPAAEVKVVPDEHFPLERTVVQAPPDFDPADLPDLFDPTDYQQAGFNFGLP